jgi:hypothetical protein
MVSICEVGSNWSGGWPPDATGNIATEDLVYLLDQGRRRFVLSRATAP